MILVTVGTQNFSFNRLLTMVDELIEEKVINDSVLAQVGYSAYNPSNYKIFNFKTETEMNEIISKANLIITHAGIGTITTALQYKKKVIVVPRLAKYREHVDNHQLEIAKAYSDKGYISIANTKEDLNRLLENTENLNSKEYIPIKSTIIDSIKQFIDGQV